MSLPKTSRTAFLLGPDRLEVRSVALQPPGEGEALLRIEAATTCGTDLKVLRRGGHPRMLRPPCPFGHEMTGILVELGAGVTGYSEGDRVVVSNSASCGECSFCRLGRENLCEDLEYLNGAFGQHLLLPHRFAAKAVYRLPAHLDFALAALAEPLACVLHGIERLRLDRPTQVLVLGGGPIGQMFVDSLSAASHRVLLADPHEDRLALGRKLGARATHRIEDRGRLASELAALIATEGDVDATIDATGSPDSWEALASVVRPGGVVNFFGGCAPGSEVRLDATRLHYGELTLLGSYHHRPASFRHAIEHLAGPGARLGSLVSGERPLEELAVAFEDMAARRAVKVLIRPNPASPQSGNSGSAAIPSPSASRS